MGDGRSRSSRLEGRNPLADQSIDRFSPLEAERANPYPGRADNAYPFAYEQAAQLFDAEAAPDLVAIHTAAHNWEDQGGHRGEHGSIDVVQARAPFIVAGAGVKQQGIVNDGCKLIDVAPTVLQLMGAPRITGRGLDGREASDVFLARQDGVAQSSVIDDRERPPEHVVGFLFDGANANVLYDFAMQGDAPNVRRLIDMGTAFGHGAMSSLPTVTLANHTSILTGAYPGHHGILNNAWWDRDKGSRSSPTRRPPGSPRWRVSTPVWRRCTRPSSERFQGRSRCRSTSPATPAPPIRSST